MSKKSRIVFAAFIVLVALFCYWIFVLVPYQRQEKTLKELKAANLVNESFSDVFIDFATWKLPMLTLVADPQRGSPNWDKLKLVGQLPYMQFLVVYGLPVDDVLLDALAGCRRLNDLWFRGTTIDVRYLEQLGRISNLRGLTFEANANVDRFVTPDHWLTDEHLKAIGTLTKIESLNLGNSHQITEHGLCDLLDALPGLKSLVIENMPEIGLSTAKALAQHPNLQYLSLVNSSLTDDHLEILCQKLNWWHLAFDNNPSITDQGLRYLETLPSLEFLSLNDTGITKHAVERFRQKKHQSSLGIFWENATSEENNSDEPNK